MKTKLSVAVVLAAVLAVCSLSTPVFGYNVTVTNDTDCYVAVSLYVYVMFKGNSLHSYRIIEPGGTYTFQTDALNCPSGFRGYVYDRDFTWEKKLTPTSILGHETSKSGFSAGCWNSSWKICRKHGSQGEQVRDNDYGFCK
jgi:hypothetical protein